MKYTEIFKAVKIEGFHVNNFDIFIIFAQNIDCGYTLETPLRGGFKAFPHSMFWIKNKYIPLYTPVLPHESGI